jgi:hypothetical protein
VSRDPPPPCSSAISWMSGARSAIAAAEDLDRPFARRSSGRRSEAPR